MDLNLTRADYCDNEKRLEWFRAAKFGMFIHWGIYAQLAGSWKGKEIPGIGEQIMRFAEIPAVEYREIAKDFNPVKFNAEEWVTLAKRAGMRYIVITAKHHDGFAMYHSHCSPYNIVDATPYRHDPMKDLAAACQKHGLKLCFYYSQYQDWDHPDGAVHKPQWDMTYPPERKDFHRYMNEKAIPQVTELLTSYGPIGVIWYDTPGQCPYYDSMRFADLVHAIQPECIVSPRVGNDLGDYIGYGDNQVPTSTNALPWETCATMNDTWGFKAQDHNWKDTGSLLRLLASIVSKGGNYLLNVGPTAQGLIPPESVERLEAIGRWLQVHGDAIYTAGRCLMPYQPEWGAVTGCKEQKKLYFHLFEKQTGSFVFNGLQTKVLRAYMMETGEAVPFAQQYNSALELHSLTLELPAQPTDPYLPVAVLELEDEPEIDPFLTEQGGRLVLNGFSAAISGKDGAHPQVQVSRAGLVENWSRAEDCLTWTFKVTAAGSYRVELNTFSEKYPEKDPEMSWEGGHRFLLRAAGQKVEFTVTADEKYRPRDLYLWHNVVTNCGTVSFPAAGIYTLTLEPQEIRYEKGLGPKLKSLVLTAE